MNRPSLDIAHLPSFAFGHRSVLWWATVGMIAIEGTVFALTIGTYFYLRSRSVEWPPSTPPPALFWGTLNLMVMLVSAVPNHWLKQAAERQDRRRSALWMWVCTAFALLFLILRIFEFRSLNVRWNTDAYGSVVWTLLGFHTAHLATDFIDSLVLGTLLITGPFEKRQLVDVAENGDYWYFVVLAWVPVYLVIYWGARVWS